MLPPPVSATSLLISGSNALTSSLVIVATCLAAGAGIGGGGLLVPIFVLSGFSPQQAIPLSVATIFGGQLTNLAFNVHQLHPRCRGRGLIDFDAAFLLEPSTLVGTIAGVLLNGILPAWSILLLLVVVLAYSSLRSYRKGKRLWAKESEAAAAIAHKPPRTLLSVNEGTPLARESTLARLEESERQPVDCVVAITLVAVWFLITLCSFAKNGGFASAGFAVSCGSVWYWILTGLPALALLGFLVYVRAKVLARHALKHRSGFVFDEADIDWSSGVDRYLFMMPVAMNALAYASTWG